MGGKRSDGLKTVALSRWTRGWQDRQLVQQHLLTKLRTCTLCTITSKSLLKIIYFQFSPVESWTELAWSIDQLQLVLSSYKRYDTFVSSNSFNNTIMHIRFWTIWKCNAHETNLLYSEFKNFPNPSRVSSFWCFLLLSNYKPCKLTNDLVYHRIVVRCIL